MTMIATQDAFANGFEMLDGAICEFVGGGWVVVRQDDQARMRKASVALTATVLSAAERLETSETITERRAGLNVDNVRIDLMGGEIITFAYFDEDTGAHEDVVLMLEDVRRMLAVLEGGTAH